VYCPTPPITKLSMNVQSKPCNSLLLAIAPPPTSPPEMLYKCKNKQNKQKKQNKKEQNQGRKR